jgi:hypothetical protein
MGLVESFANDSNPLVVVYENDPNNNNLQK